MLNPTTEKFTIDFSGELFPDTLEAKYDDFLFHKNSPVKKMSTHIAESIQSVSVPGVSLSLQNVNGLSNLGTNGNYGSGNPTTVNRVYKGNASINEIIETSLLTITFRNTIINWMYFYEFFRGAYDRNSIKNNYLDFRTSIIMRDSSDIPMFAMTFSDCFISQLPGLEFSFNQSFRESKTFDLGITFNKMDVRFLIPEFIKTNKIIKR